MLDNVMLEDPENPTSNVRVAGFAEIVKSAVVVTTLSEAWTRPIPERAKINEIRTSTLFKTLDLDRLPVR